MDQSQLNWIANFIWNIADDHLRDVYVRGKYRDVILPMTVIRRLDAVLEPTKQAVLDMERLLDEAGITNKHQALCKAAKQSFYNTSPFRLRDLQSIAKNPQLEQDFKAYLGGFSPNVREIIDKFKFHNQISTMSDANILGSVIGKFLDPGINLSPFPVKDDDGREILPGLDNHAMGTVFESLILRFNEENNEEAGEHYTPREVVDLMAQLLFVPIADRIESGTYLLYDGACGTGGMLTVAENVLLNLAKSHGKEVSIHLFGQEINPETYAICKADLLLKGEAVSEREESAQPVLANKPSKPKPELNYTRERLYGQFLLEKAKPEVVEYEPDPELRDTEQVPLLEVGGIEGFFRREVLPYAPDAWIDPEGTRIGYEISFNRYFYQPQPLRSLAEIRADMVALEQETEGLLGEILGRRTP